MAKNKMLQAIVEIAGSVSPTLGSSVESATGALEKINLKALAVTGAIGAAAAATGKAVVSAGKALYKLGEEFDSAEDKIRVGTGATGESLDALMDTAKDVFSSIPTTMEDASAAVSDYNTRLGVTGDTLGELSKQALSVSDMLGEDLSTVIEESSRAMQNWNVQEEDMSSAMDYMFKISQSTGVSFTTLSGEMQTYGAQMQELGYSFEDASALLGQLEKDGYDASSVMTALKTASKNAANDGFDSINDGMATYIEQIQNATSDTEAYSIATKLFGSKSAATMIQAIKKGTLQVDKLTSSMNESDESILKAARDTYDFGEYTTMMKSKLKVALEPLASTIFDELAKIMPKLMEMLDQIIPVISQTVEAALPFVSDFLQGIVDLLPVLLPMFQSLIESLLPILLNLVETLLPPLLELIQGLLPPLMQILEQILPPITDLIVSLLPFITEIAAAILPVIAEVLGTVLSVATPILQVLVDILHKAIMPIMEPLLDIVNTILPLLLDLLGPVLKILEPIATVLGPIADILGFIVDLVGTVIGWVVDGLGWVIGLFFDFDDDEEVTTAGHYAKGGFTHGPSIAGEEGTEAVISFNPLYRQRNIQILEEAAVMLGLSGFGEGYSSDLGMDDSSYSAVAGHLLSIDSFSLSEMAGTGGVTYIYDFSGLTWSPTINNAGAESADFMEEIYRHEAEFAEWLSAFVRAKEVQCFG